MMKKMILITIMLLVLVIPVGKLDASEMVEENEKVGNAETLELDVDTFPDDRLRSYLESEFDNDGDGKIIISEVTHLNLEGIRVYQYDGIEKLTSLTKVTMDYRFFYGHKIILPDSVKTLEMYVCEQSEAREGVIYFDYVDWKPLKDFFIDCRIGKCISFENDVYNRLKMEFVPKYIQDTGVSYIPSAYVMEAVIGNDLECTLKLFLKEYKVIDNEEIVIDKNNFPDDEFRRCLSEKFDDDGDNIISSKDVTFIYANGEYKISDFAGIEKLTALNFLSVDYYGMKNCNLSDNVEHIELYVDKSTGTLDLSGVNWIGLDLAYEGSNGIGEVTDISTNNIISFEPLYFDWTKNGYMPSAYEIFLPIENHGSFSMNNHKYYQFDIYIEEYTNELGVNYHTHIQNYGDSQGVKSNGEMAGTSGESKRLENIWIEVTGNTNLGVQYSTHCQSYGWMPWSCDGETNGTSGESKRLEAIKIQLTGSAADKYDIYYRVHAQSYGWLGWAKNGEPSGTAGESKRLEGIQIVLVKRGENAPGLSYAGIDATSSEYNNIAYIDKNNKEIVVPGNVDEPILTYRTHVQKYGWQEWKYNGEMSGTSGESKRLEGIEINLTNKPYWGDIVYTTHVQSYGWQGKLDDHNTWKSNGEMSGTSGESKRLEAICIDLDGRIADYYDVYYRVHAQNYGWLGWAKNGDPAGTAGESKRLEGIQIVVVKKGAAVPTNNYGGVVSDQTEAYIEK